MIIPDDVVKINDYKRISQRLPTIKGIAILMVITYHIWGYSKGWMQFSEIFSGNNLKNPAESFFNLICLMGEHGVHFFLIASGFGLAASWWRQNNKQDKINSPIAIISFWWRRLSRIFPLYWLAHGLVLILAIFNPTWAPQGQQLLQGDIKAVFALLLSLTTLRNLSLENYFFLNPAWWYIGLAVQLYLVFPLLAWIGKCWGWLNLLIGSLLFSLVYRGIIITLPLKGQIIDILLRGGLFPSRLFEFTLGIVLAISLLSQKDSYINTNFSKVLVWIKRLLFVPHWIGLNILLWSIGLACHWGAYQSWIFLRIPADALIGIGEFSFVFQILNLVSWKQSWLNLIGNYSYGMYLIHMNILRWLWTIFVPVVSSYWLRFGVVLMITCFLGGYFEFGYSWLEQRLIKSKI